MKAISIALIFVLLAAAQQPVQAPPAASAGTVRFQANTQLVVETVTVKDKNGKPVTGLTAKDFTITEDGVAQTISFCEFQKLDEAVPAVEPELVRRPEAAPAAGALASPQGSAGALASTQGSAGAPASSQGSAAAPAAPQVPAKLDLSSLSSQLKNRWKGHTPAASAQPDAFSEGQIRSFKIVKLDAEYKKIEVELA